MQATDRSSVAAFGSAAASASAIRNDVTGYSAKGAVSNEADLRATRVTAGSG